MHPGMRKLTTAAPLCALLATAAALWAPAGAPAAPSPNAAGGEAGQPVRCQGIASGESAGFGSFGPRNQPGPCWRPYASSSVFNRPIPGGARSRSDSRAIVSQLTRGVPISHFYSGDPHHDYGVAVYWSKPADPVYRLHCVEDWGNCDLEGLRIRVPAAARPAGRWVASPGADHDAQMTIVDQRTGWEYDLWNVRHKGRHGGVLAFGWGGRVRISGDGLRGYANAAGYGLLGGLVRISELRAGSINHALLLAVPCSGTFVYPALQGSTSCPDAGIRNSSPPPLGSRFQLTMSARQIRSLGLARWKEGLLIALHRYGAFVSDTTGDRLSWGIEVESPQTYTSFGLGNPLMSYGRSIGLDVADFWGDGFRSVHFPIPSGIDWSRMRVIAPAAASS